MTTTALVKGRAARAQLPAPLLTIAAGRSHTIETILRAWLEGKSPHTIKAYQQDLEEFALFLSRALGCVQPLTLAEALQSLFRQEAPGAHEIVLGFRHYLQNVGLSSATINRHLATLRSVSKLARQLGFCTFWIEIGGVPVERRRATMGPTVEQIAELLAATAGDSEAETRAYAMVLVMFTMGLRVAELCRLNVEDLNLDAGTVWILGKGRRQKELVPIPAPTVDAIKHYFTRRWGPVRGPLFLTRGTRGKHFDGRLETRSVLRIVRELGQRVGLHVWNHGLRHTGITIATQQSTAMGLSLDKVRAFSRHRGINTLLTYIDDRERDVNQRSLADVVANSLRVEVSK